MAIKRYIGLARERSTYGTPEAMIHTEDAKSSFKPDQNWIMPPSIARRDATKRNLGPYRTRGSIGDFPVCPEGIIGDLLYGVFGSISTSTPYGNVYIHTFSPADTLPSYTMRQGVEQTERIIPGGLVESLKVRFPHNDDIQANAEVLSGFPETKTSLGTPLISPLQALNMQGATSVLTIEGANKRNLIYDLEIMVKNNIPFDRGDLSGRTFATKRFGQREVTGKLSAYFDDTTEYDRFIAGTEFALIVRADGDIFQVGGYKYYLQFELRKCIYLRDTAPDVTPINSPLVIDAPFKAFYDTTGGFNAEAKATLQNGNGSESY